MKHGSILLVILLNSLLLSSQSDIDSDSQIVATDSAISNEELLNYYDSDDDSIYKTCETNYYNDTFLFSKLDQKYWEKIVKDLDYSEKDKQKNDNQIKVKKEKKVIPKVDPKWAKVVLFVLTGALLLFLLYKLLKGNVFLRERKIKIIAKSLEEAEERLLETDLSILLQKALATKAYHIAIRIYYLTIIQNLSHQNLLVWKKNKTNHEYATELKNNKLYNAFLNTTQLFEYIWYGEAKVDSQLFDSIQPEFINLINISKPREKQ